LADRSLRPHTSPTRLAAELEALVCQLRRRHPRWGARRISHELAKAGHRPAPSRATVHRVLVRNGLVTPQAQEHKRTYRRWQRAAPMQLWQLDLAGGVPLADGREAKLVTGIDDHSRFLVISAVVAVPSGRAVCEAFTAAMGRFGVPVEVLTDNGKQFTGRHTRPQPVEVLFERICRHNGITHRLAKPRSPTTTGKIERFHKTLRRELLDYVAPFESLQAAQEAIDGWVEAYNYQRPQQALGMATPASVFRPNGPTRADVSSVPAVQAEQPEPSWRIELVEPPPAEPAGSGAVAFEVRIPPSGEVTLAAGRQKLSLPQGLAGRTLTVWADLRSIHLTLDGHLVRTLGSRLLPEDLRYLTMRGARPAGPEPATPALPRLRGKPTIAPGGAIEVDRSVHRDGHVNLNGAKYQVGMTWAGRRITLRLDGHLLHAIAEGALIWNGLSRRRFAWWTGWFRACGQVALVARDRVLGRGRGVVPGGDRATLGMGRRAGTVWIG
jgi:transposase InsO family protein